MALPLRIDSTDARARGDSGEAIILDVVCLDGPMTVAALALLVSVCTRGKERHHVPGRNRV